jgi:hypothetical protein
METTTCQICESGIKANTGVIAHHGYQRPGQGWQTSSCFGARHVPYETGCDALPPAIERCSNFIEAQKKHLEDFTHNPPATLTRYGRGLGHKDEVFERPEGYVYNEQHGSFNYNEKYALQHHNAIYHIKKNIEHAERDLPRLEKRLADWKPRT